MITLSKEQIKYLHTKLLSASGGLDGDELYLSTTAKIARLAYSLVCNHPFVDGNKRIGVYVMLVMLEMNHIAVNFTDDDIISIGLGLACGTMDDKALLDFILEKFV